MNNDCAPQLKRDPLGSNGTHTSRGLMSLMGAVFISQPWLALIPAVVFLALYRLSHHKLAAAAAVSWLLYAAYEYAMHRRWLCTGECNIRIDLLLIYPLLLLLSATAAVAAVVAIARRRPAAP